MSDEAPSTGHRRDELARRLRAVQQRIRAAAAAADRDPADVTLVVVTKTWPASDIRALLELGIRDVGENRQQELDAKARELDDADLRWHFVGQIQSNKAPRVAEVADVVHSVGSVRVAQRLNAGAARRERSVRCFLQVSLDVTRSGEGRGGLDPDEIDEVARGVETCAALELVGVMAVAPLGVDPASAYMSLRETSQRLQRSHPHATAISAGMSADFETAIVAGATHVRVGSAVLGRRPKLG
ncbi:MAG: YggS family pyridoxal phosphate-dependent enzyme [Propionibacteriales bacterium]|nr:YggS family pyridoxal phosphate-dependent enzyme [Propionibacteriales bacterium]